MSPKEPTVLSLPLDERSGNLYCFRILRCVDLISG